MQPDGQSNGGGVSSLLMSAIFILFMYFAIWRPQSKRAKEQRRLIDTLATGDEVVTASGIIGKISKINDHYITLTVADAAEMTVQKNSITGLLPKGTLKSL